MAIIIYGVLSLLDSWLLFLFSSTSLKENLQLVILRWEHV